MNLQNTQKDPASLHEYSHVAPPTGWKHLRSEAGVHYQEIMYGYDLGNGKRAILVLIEHNVVKGPGQPKFVVRSSRYASPEMGRYEARSVEEAQDLLNQLAKRTERGA